MTERDAAADLEFWSGRGRGGSVVPGQGPDPDRPRPPYRRTGWARLEARLSRVRFPHVALPTFGPRDAGNGGSGPSGPSGRARPVAAVALLAGLAAAWLVIGHQPRGSTSAAATDPIAAAVPTTVPEPAAAAAPTTVPATDPLALRAVSTPGCNGLSATRPHVRCTVDDVIMEVALYADATVGPALRRLAGAQMKARSGPASCANGEADERAWSVASAPLHAVGRYVCRLESGRAAMWWTHGDRLLHALAGSRRDGNLARLFSWWRAHPSA